MTPRRISAAFLATLLVAVALLVAACGGSAGPDLSPEAAAGRDIARTAGCAACHGDNGQGGVGPAWTGLAGSTVDLADGTTVVADEEYLRRAIVDPTAERTAGYDVQMPPNSLTDEEVTKVIGYITALGR